MSDLLGKRVDFGDPLDEPMPDRWGVWHFNRDNLTLEFRPGGRTSPVWYVDLERCNKKEDMLTWILSFASKEYGANLDPTPAQSLADLVQALRAILFYGDPHGPGYAKTPAALRRPKVWE